MPVLDSVHIVAADETGDAAEASAAERLDHLLSRRLAEAGLSRSRIQALIRAGAVSEQASGDIVADPSRKVKPGASFAVRVPAPAPSHLDAQKLPLHILYEDDSLLVLDKPAGQAVHPAPGHRRDTLVNALLAHCGASLSGIGGVARPGIVHRLDKHTSGLLVVAKHDSAHRALAQQFAAHGRDGALQRQYIALVWGRPVPDVGRIDLPIGRGSGRGGSRARLRMSAAPARGGKPAVTRYQVVQKYAAASAEEPVASRLSCCLETGRTHQIRAHLSHIGHPLLGDPLYGAGFRTRIQRLPEAAAGVVAGLRRQALHACVLGFQHPESGEPLRFQSPLPADLERVAAALADMQG